jgi:F-type H+-transporting ATPase subunit c
MQGIGRNPDAAGIIQTNMILGIVFTEAVAIYALVVSLVIIFVL